jgi:2-oxoglutarate dehydrogenase E1 component
MGPSTEFKRMICDSGPASQNPEGVKKVIFCTGKVFYDLAKARRDAGLFLSFFLNCRKNFLENMHLF